MGDDGEAAESTEQEGGGRQASEAVQYIVHVYSLESKDRQRMAKSLTSTFGDIGVLAIALPLLRSELKGIKLGPLRSEERPCMIVLCHHNEGRVLLTDEDGMYNDFIREACRLTGGNVFLALSPVETSGLALANERLVSAMAYAGGQNGLLSIHVQQRFLTWDKKPSDAQLVKLGEAIRGKADALEVPESLLEPLRPGQRGSGASSFCNFL